MRVAVVHGLLRGGAARRLSGTVEELLKHSELTLREFSIEGAVTAVQSSPDGGSSEARFAAPWTARAPELRRVCRPPYRYLDDLRLELAWKKVAREVNSWRPDVIFLNPDGMRGGAPSGAPLMSAPCLYYCDEPRRIDYEAEAAASTNESTRGLYGRLRRRQKRLDRAATLSASRLVTNSCFTESSIKSAYGLEAVVITPGVNAIFGSLPRSTDDPEHLLSVGTLIPSKGHGLVIEAAAQSAVDLPVIVVAPREDPHERDRLNALAAKLSVRLEIRIGVTDQTLSELYRRSFATLYLARDEPLGLVSLESQACGTPVIVADEGGLASTLIEGVTGRRVTRTPDGAARALDELASGSTRARMAAAAALNSVPRDVDAAAALMEQFKELTRIRMSLRVDHD